MNCRRIAESASEVVRCSEGPKNRGLKDILILCSDGLTGLKSVLEEAYSLAKIQRCVVHKTHNCFKLEFVIAPSDRFKVSSLEALVFL